MWESSKALKVGGEDKVELERLARSGKTEQRVAFRARIILGAAAGKSNHALAQELKTSRPTIIAWRKRFTQGGVKALQRDRPRGRGFQRGSIFGGYPCTKEAEYSCQDDGSGAKTKASISALKR